MNVKTKFENNKFRVWSDYNRQFVEVAKKLGGKWNKDKKTWDFDERNAELVKPVLYDFYGTDGESTPDTVTIKIRYPNGKSASCDSISLFGRVIAVAYGRDSGAKLGHGVVMIQGDIDSGGSVKNWTTEIEPDSIFVLHDFPRNRVNEITSCEVMEVIEREQLPNPPVIDRDELRREKERILIRLNEIELLLQTEIHIPEIGKVEIPDELKD